MSNKKERGFLATILGLGSSDDEDTDREEPRSTYKSSMRCSTCGAHHSSTDSASMCCSDPSNYQENTNRRP